MKKILYIIMCAVLGLTSCSKEELPTVGGQNPDGSYTFNIGIEEPDYVVSSAPKTRAEVKMTRYLLEMYEGSLSATPVKMENTNGVFNVELKKGVDYVCLFWADGGAADYDAASLKAVKQTDETKTGTAAYCAGVTVNSKTFNGAIKLKRAVAELSFIDKNGLTDASNTLKITYPYASATLNVSDGTVTHAAGTAVRTITGITPPAQATDAFTTDFILAPKEAGKLTGLKFQLNTEEEKTIAETAVQANFKTKITGEYWKDVLKVGSYYYNDNTFSTKYDTKGGTRTCIGIVFVVNADGKSGKIVSLDEITNTKWSTENIKVGASSDTDGAVNTTTVLTSSDYIADKSKYPAFVWCAAKNTPVIAGINWYIPAKSELQDGIFANKTTLNTSLALVNGATQLSTDSYWTSTEKEFDGAWGFHFGDGTWYDYYRDRSFSVRVVSAFGENPKPAAKVGDYYYTDGTWSSTYTADAANPCLGIVFYVNADGKSGKIVGLDEPIENWNGTNDAGKLTWGPILITTAATNDINGLVNMATIKDLDNTFAAYPAFAWVHAKNAGISNLDYSTATKGVWYLPATKELHQLYAAMSGLKWVASGAVAANGEIDDWENAKAMPNDTYATARTAFSALFTAAGKTTMDLSGYYWSSTEGSDYNAWYVYFYSGFTYGYNKNVNSKVRAVLAF